MSRHLVMYMTSWCPNSSAARECLTQWGVAHTCIDISKDPAAAACVRGWTGFESVPTLVLCDEGSLLPCTPPADLRKGATARGVDRGSMITEPNREQLQAWLERQGLMAEPPAAGAGSPAHPPAGQPDDSQPWWRWRR